MIRLYIGKNTEVKYKSLASVLHQRLGRNLHHHRITAGLSHLRQIALQNIGLRRGILSRNMLIADNCFYCTDKPHLKAGILQNRLYQIS